MTLPPTPDKLDELLVKHFDEVLEPQRGRTLAAFRNRTLTSDRSGGTSGAAAPAKIHNVVSSSRRYQLLWAGVPSLIAACLALVLTLQFINKTQPASTPVGSKQDPGSTVQNPSPEDGQRAIAFDAPALDQVDLSRDVDGGVTLLNDNTPVRLIRHQTLHDTQWVDPVDKATYRVTEPVEKVGYVQVQPY